MQNEVREQWNRMAAHFQSIVREHDDGYPDRQMAFLQEQGTLFPGAVVADIGCGAGKYAIRFAELGCGLKLLDIADNMMDYAKQNLADAGVPVETYLCDWSETDLAELGGEDSVDLAFAAMTPALQTREDVRKFTAMSRKYCFVSRFADRKDLLLTAAAEACGLALPERDHAAASREMLGWLLEDGYLPEVRRIPYGWENLRTVEEAYEILLRSDLGNAVREAGKEVQLKQWLQTQKDEAGMIHEVVQSMALWVLWEK